jgi:Arc/MetJ-type ribon-helix-helix transcriptional regulator
MLKRRNSIPGFQEGGMNVDPVSGNEVPVGSLPEEVRDDVDAKLSPGEFVIPADVVRFIGLERLMKMRDEAKKGIQRMSEIGQMGNADEVGEESNSTYEDDGFESEIDDILGEVERENGVDDQMRMAFGGYVASGTDLTKAPKNPAFDVRYYKNKEGSTMYITHINGKPMTPVPEGFKEVTSEEAAKVGTTAEEARKDEQNKEGFSSGVGAGGGEVMMDPGTLAFLDKEEKAGTRGERMEAVSRTIGRSLPIVGPINRAIEAIKGPQRSDEKAPVESRTPTSVVDIIAREEASKMNLNAKQTDILVQNAKDFVSQRGDSPTIAVQNAVAASKQAEAVTKAAEEQYEATSGADVGPPAPAPGSVAGGIDDNWGMAKGGLVNKRQYPAKKKKGKGIAASK